MSSTPLSVSIRPSRVAAGLAGVTVVLVLVSTAGQLVKFVAGHPNVYGLVPRTFVGSEQSVPTYYASFLLLFAAVLLGWITLAKRRAQDRYALHWTGLTFLFFAMSLDEIAMGHEMLIRPMRELIDVGGVFYFAWVIPGLVFLVVFALVYLRFLFHLPRRFQWLFGGAGVLYVGGAVGVEMLGGLHADRVGVGNLTYRMYQTFEESCEMFGAILFIYALLQYVAHFISSTEVVVAGTSAPGRRSGKER